MAGYNIPNYGYELPDDPSVKFHPLEIRHYTLMMDATGSKFTGSSVKAATQKMLFKLHWHVVKLDGIHDKEAYVEQYALTAPAPIIRSKGTPWDIRVEGKQCYIVLDLDAEAWMNWRFIGPGMTSKKPTNGGDFGLYWVKQVTKGRSTVRTIECGDIDDDVCTRIFFGVARRKKHEHGRQMNFFTGFVQDHMIMPVIYDPDVPNTGAGIGSGGGGGGGIVAPPVTAKPKGRREEEVA